MPVYPFCKECKCRRDRLSITGKECRDKIGHRKFLGHRLDLQLGFLDKRIREVFDRREQALEVEAKLRDTHRENKYFGKKPGSGDLSFRALTDKYKTEHVIPNNRNPEKTAFYKLEQIKAYFGDRPIKDITRDDLLAFQKELVKGGKQNSTSNRILRIVKAILNKGMEWGFLSNNPAEYVSYLQEEDPIPRFLTEKEIGLVWKCAKSNELRQYMIELLHTGARPSSLAACRWENGDVDFENRIIWFTTYKGAKGKQHRYYVPIDDALYQVLKDRSSITGQRGPVFINPVSLDREARRAIRDSKINEGRPYNQRFTIYGFKHCYASHLLMNGASLHEVALLLGHTDDKMVRKHYGHLTQDYLRKVQSKVNLTKGLDASMGRQISDTVFENACPQTDLNRSLGLERAKLSQICNTKNNLN